MQDSRLRRWGILCLACALALFGCDDGTDADRTDAVGGQLDGGGAADAARLDAALPDGARPDLALPDGALPDGALPDGALPDGALPDGALPDAEGPDGALPDAEGPDGALPDAEAPDPCDGQPEGMVTRRGEATACAFDTACGEAGAQTRIDQVCRGGIETPELVRLDCSRDSEGLVVTADDFGACVYEDNCAQMGAQQRPQQVCRDGAPVAELGEQPCARDTEGLVVRTGAYGACVFAGACAEAGLQTRNNRVCRDGRSAPEAESTECRRETEGDPCLDGGRCLSGTCACPVGQPDVCADRCVQLDADPQFCGACDVACADTQRCLAGRCVSRCGDGVVDAEEQCDDGNDDDSDGCARCRRTGPQFCSGPCVPETTVAQVAPVHAGSLSRADVPANFRLGGAVGISGDWVAIGADGTSAPSSVYLSRRDAQGRWTETQPLRSTDYADDDRFGAALAIRDTSLVVGAPYDDHEVVDGGSVYVFDRGPDDQWLEVAKLLATAPRAGDRFGAAVATTGTQIIVGADLADDNGEDAGAAFVYAFSRQREWALTARLVGTEVVAGDHFGAAVAIAGSIAVVGAPADASAGERTGAAYVFRRLPPSDWVQVARLQAPDGHASMSFGTSVSVGVDGEVLVGAPGANFAARAGGAVYRFVESVPDHWTLAQTLVPDDIGVRDGFGFSQSQYEQRLVVGATLSGGTGAAYVFSHSRGDDWTGPVRVVAPVPAVQSFFGRAVATDGTSALVGAPLTNGAGADLGAAHAYTLHQPTCTDDGLCLCASDLPDAVCSE